MGVKSYQKKKIDNPPRPTTIGAPINNAYSIKRDTVGASGIILLMFSITGEKNRIKVMTINNN